MPDPAPSPDTERRSTAARAWLQSAAGDVAIARSLLLHRDEDVAPFGVAFHAQQAAEKATKALLLELGIDFPPTHDLTALIDLLPPTLAALAAPAVTDLTPFAVIQRYPAPSHDAMTLQDEVDWREAEAAISVAEEYVRAIRARIDAMARDGAGSVALTVARSPLVVMLAGPNGAGKSTIASALLRGAYSVEEFVNADTIAAGLSAYRPQAAAVTAGRVMLQRLHHLADARTDFAFETTLSGRGHARLLRTLQASGYRSHLIFLSLPDAEAAVDRVADRVRRGGHEVPADVIRRRYLAGLRNLFGLYQRIVDSWQVYDNASLHGPRLLAAGSAGQDTAIVDAEAWARLEQHR